MNTLHVTLVSILAAAIVALSPATSLAGGAVMFTADVNRIEIPSFVNVSTIIREQVAVTTTTELFVNRGSTASTLAYGYLLRNAQTVTKLRWRIKGVWFAASTVADPDSTGTGDGDPSDPARNEHFLQYYMKPGATLFSINNSIAAGDSILIELTYVELLSYRSGTVAYDYRTTSHYDYIASSPVVNRWTIDIASGSPLHPITIGQGNQVDTTQLTPTTAVLVGTDVDNYSRSLQLTFVPQYDNLTMNVLSTKPADEDGYALMLATPKNGELREDVMPKRVTFVLDRSGSMVADPLKRAQDAAILCVQELRPQDVFNVILFDNDVTTWKAEYQFADPPSVSDATAFINSTFARGGTDIMTALKEALRGHKPDMYVNTVIFLTDGEAGIDHEELKRLNTSGTRIYVFGIGSDVNAPTLTQIAEDSRGRAFFPSHSGEVVSAVTELFQEVKDPLFKNPYLTYSPNVVYDVYPTIIPDIYDGQQLMLVGRYTTPGDVTVTLHGVNRTGTVEQPFAAYLTDQPDINLFVAKIWARQRIDLLLDWMHDEPEGSSRWKEWQEEITRLGIKYGIPTPFTSLVDNGTQDDGGQTTTVTHDEIIVADTRCRVSPNPIREATTITVDLTGMVTIPVNVQIVDINGIVLTTLFDGYPTANILTLEWNGSDQFGNAVPSGVYHLVLTVDGRVSTMMLSVVR
jgi:Ca-activated chloride channel family protein